MNQFLAKSLAFAASYPSKVPAIRVWTFSPFPPTNELLAKRKYVHDDRHLFQF